MTSWKVSDVQRPRVFSHPLMMFTVTYMYNISICRGDEHPSNHPLFLYRKNIISWVWCILFFLWCSLAALPGLPSSPKRRLFYLMLKRSLVDDSCTSTGRRPGTASEADWGRCYLTKLWGVRRHTSRKCTVITEPLHCHQTNQCLRRVWNTVVKFKWTDTTHGL